MRQSLLDLQELDIKYQGGVARDTRLRSAAVGQLGGDGDAALSAHLHALETNLPSLDDLTLAETEGERLALLVGYTDN